MRSDVHGRDAGGVTAPDPASAGTGGLHQDVGCPGCGYNLRGLGSDDVVCPECGLQSNLPALLVRRWDKPWHKAPKYNLLVMPAGWLLVAAIGLLFAAVVNELQDGGILPWRIVLAGWSMMTLLGWVLLMVWVCRSMGGLGTVGYTLLVHVALAGYLLGLPMFVTGLAWTAFDLFEAGRNQHNLFWSVLLLIGGVVLFAIGRMIERLVAGYCIRLYLRRPTTSG